MKNLLLSIVIAFVIVSGCITTVNANDSGKIIFSKDFDSTYREFEIIKAGRFEGELSNFSKEYELDFRIEDDTRILTFSRIILTPGSSVHINQYLLPGKYTLRLSGSNSTLDYKIKT